MASGFNWRITNYLESLLQPEENVILRRRMTMYRIRKMVIKLARESGIVVNRPYASWESDASHVENPSIEESYFHKLVLGDRNRTTGQIADQCLVRFVDDEKYAMKVGSEMRRMVKKAKEHS